MYGYSKKKEVYLREPDDFAGNIAGVPDNCYFPNNIRQDADDAHAQICRYIKVTS